MYYPLRQSAKVRQGSVVGTMPVNGSNLRDFSQLLNANSALYIENYWVDSQAKLKKRSGSEEYFDTSESNVITTLGAYQNNYEISAYGVKVRARNAVGGAFTDIKTDFSSGGVLNGLRAGDYFFVTSNLNGLWRISQTVTYTASVAFVANEKITGSTSGATAIVLEVSGGTLTLGSINGTFQNGEPVTGNASGSGTLTSTVSFTIANVSAAPKAKYIAYDGKRLWLYNLATDAAGWAYSRVDDGTNPPFTNWTTSSSVEGGGSGTYRNGVACTGLEFVGDIVFLSFEKGWNAFKISTLDSSGTISKYEELIQLSDLGIKAIKMTDAGLIAVGTWGIKRLVSVGQAGVPYSEQWETLTEQLGDSYFQDVNFDNASIVYDSKRGYLYVACAKGGGTLNNFILAIKLGLAGVDNTVENGATSFFTGLNPQKFFLLNDEIYFSSSLDGRVYHLFTGEQDDGVNIYAEYYQELNFGEIYGTFNLDEIMLYGEFTRASDVDVSFDVFDENSHFISNVATYVWSAYNDYNSGSGWGGSAWANSAWGTSGVSSGLIYDKADLRPRIRNVMRVRLRISSQDASDHTINMFSARASLIGQSRSHKLTQV